MLELLPLQVKAIKGSGTGNQCKAVFYVCISTICSRNILSKFNDAALPTNNEIRKTCLTLQ